MEKKEDFIQEIQSRYSFKDDKIVLGKAKLNDVILPEAEISISLKKMNLHGLISGATGTGKTKSLQVIAEQLSLKGVPTLLMDIKGDLSGIAEAGNAEDKGIQSRQAALGIPYEAQGSPVEFLSISDEKGIRLRATVEEFGPVFFSKMLELNETQESIISILFKFCADKNIRLISLQDMRDILRYVSEDKEGKAELTSNYGTISSASLGIILRKIIALEQQGADKFFGSPSFDVNDLLKLKDGKGVINIIRLSDIQNNPNLFSTFMLSLLAKIYNTFPEVGNPDKPKLVIFFDESHLLFKEATRTLINQIETTVKLIRSKGVGLFFATQLPSDIPDVVLSQLGLKVQHALRGFTAKDRKQIEKAVENYPISAYYKTSEVITQLGTGEAFVTGLDEKGIPTPLAYTHMRAPNSRMDILTDEEIEKRVNSSDLVSKYAKTETNTSVLDNLPKEKKVEKAESTSPKRATKTNEKSWTDNRMVRDIGRTAIRKLIDWGMKIVSDFLKKKTTSNSFNEKKISNSLKKKR